MDPLEARSPQFHRGERRLILLARFALIWALVIGGRLVYLQVFKKEVYQKLADSQQQRELEIQAPRGEILDSRGKRLAMSVPMESVCLNPREIKDAGVAATVLTNVLGGDARELAAKIRLAKERNRGFLWVRRLVPYDQAERLKELNLEWVQFRQESKRFYPNGSLASNLIGAVGDGEGGSHGLELSLDPELRGRPGTVRMLMDVKMRGLDSEIEVEAQPGRTVALTIDSRIQYVADNAIRNAVLANRCSSGSVVVMDPRNGHILAMSSYPTFDPNEPAKDASELAWRANQAVSVPFEPGSIFKTFTWAAGLETRAVSPEARFAPASRINVFGLSIGEHTPFRGGTAEDGFVKSSNTVAAQIGLAIRGPRLYEYLTRRFGFGRKTGLPLPGESPGMVRPLERWNKGSAAFVAIGHEIGATTVQLARGVSVIANGGMLVKPKLVLWKKRPGEEPVYEKEEAPERVIGAETAVTMRRLMREVVRRGTGTRAQLDGYSTGGKTGSAKLFDFKTRRYVSVYNASFMGFAPVTSPNVVVVVTLNGAKEFGGKLAAPVFKEVAGEALRIRQAPRDLVGVEAAPPEEDNRILADASSAPASMPAELAAAIQEAAFDEAAGGVVVGPRVPNFRGMTLSAVLRECVNLGLEVEVNGKGLARAQEPPAGRMIAAGQRVRVTFAR